MEGNILGSIKTVADCFCMVVSSLAEDIGDYVSYMGEGIFNFDTRLQRKAERANRNRLCGDHGECLGMGRITFANYEATPSSSLRRRN